MQSFTEFQGVVLGVFSSFTFLYLRHKVKQNLNFDIMKGQGSPLAKVLGRGL